MEEISNNPFMGEDEVPGKVEETIGKKNDNGKLRWDCVYLPSIKGIAKVMDYGLKKYGVPPEEENWKHVKDGKNRYYAAMMRHLCAYQEGQIIDPESNLPHMDHFLFNAMALNYFCNKEDSA